MNNLFFLKKLRGGKILHRTFLLLGLSVAAVVAFGIFSGTSQMQEVTENFDEDDGVCTRTATAAFTACRFEAEDNYQNALGNCFNVADESDRAQCRLEAETARSERRSECAVHREAREDICDVLGEGPYDPQINPAQFVNPAQIGTTVAPNPYFLLIRGRTMVYRKGTEEVRVTVTNQTRELLGVTCATVRDVVRNNGQIIEDTTDWYGQDINGNVWYFGEIAQEIDNGILIGIGGSWTAGVDRAKPGFAAKFMPVVGELYRQEFALNNAEDMAQVVSRTASAVVPAARCKGNCVVTKDTSPIIPTLLEFKYYKPGVGFILQTKPGTTERLELVQIIQN